MRRMMCVCILFAATGCAGDPRRSPLDAGAEMTIANADPGPSEASRRGEVPVHVSNPEDDRPYDTISLGTKVRVIGDPNAEAEPYDDMREVRALVLEGRLEGKVITIGRYHLRPLR